jgi:hypothetical protein
MLSPGIGRRQGIQTNPDLAGKGSGRESGAHVCREQFRCHAPLSGPA